jgi:hypothetical protein
MEQEHQPSPLNFMDQYARKSMTLRFKPSYFTPPSMNSQAFDRYGEVDESVIEPEQYTNPDWSSNAPEGSDLDEDLDSHPLFASQRFDVFTFILQIYRMILSRDRFLLSRL